jgi:hypothetical protein
MIVLAFMVLGAAVGAWRAHRRQGTRLDLLQWGAVYAIIFALAGLILTIALERLA